jgi:integrase
MAILEGYVFRPVNRGDRITGDRLSEKVVWQMLKPYAIAVGLAGIAPHDLRRYAESRTMPNAITGRA